VAASRPRAAALACAVERRPARPDEIEAAWQRLGQGAGLYFGGDAGIAGLHPPAALLLVEPSLALRVFVDGLEVEPRDPLGAALLARPAVAAWREAAARRRGGTPLSALRAFLALFDDGGNAPADAVLAGALRFEAHRLGAAVTLPPGEEAALGVFFFAPVSLQRDAAGVWQRVAVSFADAALAHAAAEAAPCAGRVHGGIAGTDDGSAPRDDFPPGGYARVVAAALSALNEAGLVSLTLSQSFRRRLGERTPAEAFARLREVNPAPATFYIDGGDGEVVFGASPDLQLRVAGREVDAFPVCGTVARGHGPVGEAEALRILFDEEVDAASLAICSDALRNDLAPLCEPGSLRLLARRRPMALATVVHAVDQVHGRLREGVDAWDAILATAAPVMVTGTPRAAALAAIAAHEAGPRGWYGGLVVEVRGDGAARVGTILRAATVRGGVAEVRTGGDLVAGSEPAREELESRVKAVSLWRALGLAVDVDLEARVAGSAPTAAAVDALALPAAVALEAEGDPFAAGLAESLRGVGLALDETAATVVFAGGDDLAARSLAARARGVVAIGDAAARLLRAAGHPVVATPPRHGRLVHCVPVEGTPSAAMRPFTALRYATLALADGDPGRDDAGNAETWSTWLRDADGGAVVLARAAPPAVCFLLRPESLLSDPLALELLRTAIAFVADRGRAATG
jgi:anthranilate/para-aminobenzoate synthase component I